MLGAALLDADTYEEVEADASATGQALAVVALVGVAGGVGTIANHGVDGILWHTLNSVILWWLWAFVTYFVGTRLLPTSDTVADHGELLRTIGFSCAPGLLLLLCLIEPIGGLVFAAALLWMWVAMVVAAVCAIGFPVYAFGQLVSILLLGPWPI
jgi:hypothetical protein